MIHDSWMMLVGGFLLFRVFDIVKPWPVKRFERLPGGLGIMADDQIAALYAGAVLVLLQSCGL
jgi:phosphatidylglycerophosphatase A